MLGRTEFRRALHGATPAEVKQQNCDAIKEWEAEIAAARATLRGDTLRLTQKQVLAICGEWYRGEIAQWEDDPGDPVGWQISRDILLDGMETASSLKARAAAHLRGLGIAADVDSLDRFTQAWRETRTDLYETLRRRATGDYAPDKTAIRFPTKADVKTAEKQATPLPAADLLALWAKEEKRATSTLRKYTSSFAQVARILGFDDFRRITEEDVIRFKGARLDEGVVPKTVSHDVLAGSVVCKWAVKNKHIKANPFQGLAPTVGNRGEETRFPYTDEEAAIILNAARKEATSRRWLPWLLAFTGARISEIADMQRGHVREDSGVMILDICPVKGRAGKNETFQRKLPIHPAVLDEGFLAYVASLPADPTAALFPDITVAPDGTRSPTAQTNHMRWVRRIGVRRKGTVPAHSWRHRMEDALRRVRAHPEVMDAITGRYNPRNAGAEYGNGFRGMPDETIKDLRKVPLPPGVKPPPP
ncbi:hypothetical protein ACQW02_23495 [Humitalea sp. 24SJ18S-53]|uniref:hypothetical protein n=1 Tax=Humitalea sp. 24SJ18S-53 TaxID=3422307 RepID=UPI003D678018